MALRSASVRPSPKSNSKLSDIVSSASVRLGSVKFGDLGFFLYNQVGSTYQGQDRVTIAMKIIRIESNTVEVRDALFAP